MARIKNTEANPFAAALAALEGQVAESANAVGADLGTQPANILGHQKDGQGRFAE